jgi:hypothetical protein
LAAIFTCWAYGRFRHEVQSGIDEADNDLKVREHVEWTVGGIDPSPQQLRRYTQQLVRDALKSVLPGRIAYFAIGFAALSGILAFVSVLLS